MVSRLFLLSALVAGGCTGASLPECDSTDTRGLVGKIINDVPSAKEAGIQFVSLKGVTEQGYNEVSQIRSCAATLVTTAGEDDVQYHVKWVNKDANQFYVEARSDFMSGYGDSDM